MVLFLSVSLSVGTLAHIVFIVRSLYVSLVDKACCCCFSCQALVELIKLKYREKKRQKNERQQQQRQRREKIGYMLLLPWFAIHARILTLGHFTLNTIHATKKWVYVAVHVLYCTFTSNDNLSWYRLEWNLV